MITFKNRLRQAVLSIFDKGNNPMKNTLDYPGDPGLFGPESVTWRIISDVSGFMAGVRALMVQAAHPEVADGFVAHSQLHSDPLGRISRTGEYVAVTAFGSMPEVHQMVSMVKKIHERVQGVSSRGIEYSANQPSLAAWVHYALIQSFLIAYRMYGDEPLLDQDADKFVKEHIPLAKLMDIDILLTTEQELHDWISNHSEIAQTPATLSIMDFLKKPPINFSMRVGYGFLFDAAVHSIPSHIQEVLTLKPTRWGVKKGAFFTKSLRLAMGFSPSLKVACDRLNISYPTNRWFVLDRPV